MEGMQDRAAAYAAAMRSSRHPETPLSTPVHVSSDVFTKQAWRDSPHTAHTQMNLAALMPCNAFSASVNCLYAQPLQRQQADVAEVQKAEAWLLPEDIDYR